MATSKEQFLKIVGRVYEEQKDVKPQAVQADDAEVKKKAEEIAAEIMKKIEDRIQSGNQGFPEIRCAQKIPINVSDEKVLVYSKKEEPLVIYIREIVRKEYGEKGWKCSIHQRQIGGELGVTVQYLPLVIVTLY